MDEIREKTIVVEDKSWKKTELEADTVVLAIGYRANRALCEQLGDKTADIYVIGGASRPRKIVNAIHDGNKIARQI